MTVQAKHSWMQAAELLAALQPALDEIAEGLPAGYSIEIGGRARGRAPRVVGGAVRVRAPTAWRGDRPAAGCGSSTPSPSRRSSFITIPLSFIGAAIGLLATGAYMGFMAMLGFLSLAGIIINNAIVLLDQIQVEIDQGATPYDAVITASVSRFQPVMMTTLTTILGLLPLMIPPDPLFFAMAVVIAAGLSVGTILTLATVPVLYTLFHSVKLPPRQVAAPAPAAEPMAAE